MLTDDEITAMRATVDGALPETGVLVKRSTPAADGMGGSTLTWATVATVTCRISPNTTREEELAGDRVTNTQRWLLTFPAGTDVRPADRIVAGARTFDVSSIRGARSFELARQVIAVEVL